VIEEIAPGSVEALARFAATAADDESYLEEVAAALALDANVGRLPPALARRVVRGALEAAAPGRAFSAGHLDETVDMAGRPGTGARDLPGVTVRSRDGALSIEARGLDVGESAGGAPFEVALPIPGRATLPGGRVSVSAAIQPGVVSEEMRAGGDMAVVQADVLAAPLVVRNRRPGDRLRPLGAPGHRKLQDLLVDRKVPRDERDRVPLVVDATGRIVWVAGIAIADECRVTAPAAGVVVLKVLREGIS
jgi:tRNA(Ile)-lysidine synthase